MQQQEAVQLFDKWVHLLHLEAWYIDFQWRVRAEHMDVEDSTGCVSFRHATRQAIVQILDPVDYIDKLVPFNYEKTLIHELLHIKFADLDNSGDPLRDKLTHQMVDDLARAFVECQEG